MRPLILCLLALVLVACEAIDGPMQPSGTYSTPAAVATPSQTDALASTDDYRLGSGDRLRVIVYDEEGLSGEFLVDGSGNVSMPLIGQVIAQGRTTQQFEMAVEEKLRGRYLRDPQVSAEVMDFRPFYILGEVNRPGTYPYTSGLTVLNAVATAEGFTYRANQRVVYIRRAGQEREQQYQLTSTTMVNPGDTIRIAERIF